jgi:hypothetical protein
MELLELQASSRLAYAMMHRIITTQKCNIPFTFHPWKRMRILEAQGVIEGYKILYANNKYE